MNGHVLESEKGESPQKSKAPESCNQQGDYLETTLKPTPITIAHQTGTDFSTISGKNATESQADHVKLIRKKSLRTAIYLIQILSDSISTCGQEGISDPNQQKEHSIFTRKIRLPATYRNPNREKLFACSYCTMKFAKAINLYKHLKVKTNKYATPPFYSYTASECVVTQTIYTTIKKHFRFSIGTCSLSKTVIMVVCCVNIKQPRGRIF